MIVRAAEADALVLVPRGEGELAAGLAVRYLPLASRRRPARVASRSRRRSVEERGRVARAGGSARAGGRSAGAG